MPPTQSGAGSSRSHACNSSEKGGWPCGVACKPDAPEGQQVPVRTVCATSDRPVSGSVRPCDVESRRSWLVLFRTARDRLHVTQVYG